MFARSPWSSIWPLYAGVLLLCIIHNETAMADHLSMVPSRLHWRLLNRAHILLAHIQRASCTCVFPRSLAVLNINVGIISEAPKELRNAGPAVNGEMCFSQWQDDRQNLFGTEQRDSSVFKSLWLYSGWRDCVFVRSNWKRVIRVNSIFGQLLKKQGGGIEVSFKVSNFG